MDSLRRFLNNLEFKEVVPGVNAFSVCYKDGTVLHVRSGNVTSKGKHFRAGGATGKGKAVEIALGSNSKAKVHSGFLVTICGKTIDIDSDLPHVAQERPLYLQDGV